MLTCPKCNNHEFVINREITYVYSYKVNPKDENIQSSQFKSKEYPYLFYNREILDSKEYIKCSLCGTKYPFNFKEYSQNSNMTILQRAIRSDNIDNPNFLG